MWEKTTKQAIAALLGVLLAGSTGAAETQAQLTLQVRATEIAFAKTLAGGDVALDLAT